MANFEINYFNIDNGVIKGEVIANDEITSINIYNCEDFYQANPLIITHEFCHMLQPINDYEYYGFRELVNIYFNNKYYSNDFMFDETYLIMQKYIYCLLSIVDEKVLDRYQIDLDITEIKMNFF